MLLCTVTNYCSSRWQVLIIYDFLEDTGFTAVWFGTETLSVPPPSTTLWNIKNYVKLEKNRWEFRLKISLSAKPEKHAALITFSRDCLPLHFVVIIPLWQTTDKNTECLGPIVFGTQCMGLSSYVYRMTLKIFGQNTETLVFSAAIPLLCHSYVLTQM